MIFVYTDLERRWIRAHEDHDDLGVVWNLPEHIEHMNQKLYADDYAQPLWVTLRLYPCFIV